MFGLKNLEYQRLLAVFMALSGAMMVFGTVLSPSDGASIATSLIWIAGAIILIGVWILAAIELARRHLTGGDSADERSGGSSATFSPENPREKQRRGE